MSSADIQAYRDALSSFPSGVTIVTTTDSTGRHWGFTASSFTSVSMDPPLVLVCLAAKAESHPAFIQAKRFTINVLAQEQKNVALHFSRKHDDKFRGQNFQYAGGTNPEPPSLSGASAKLACLTHDLFHLGDHLVLVGEVKSAKRGADAPLIYCNRDFWALEPATEGVAA